MVRKTRPYNPTSSLSLPAGRETWYVQCKRYASITFVTLRDELDKLAHTTRHRLALCS